ncbi:hypothetical protein DL768_007116 [Monosporascus sp. mg162]|nr:hypothetical protein DL768_007116 [Monosporascus sp. mg162]
MPPRNQSKKTRNRRYGSRPYGAVPIPAAHVCRPCFGKAEDAFRPHRGLPFEVSCTFRSPDSSACTGCSGGYDTCEPGAGFDQRVLFAAAQWRLAQAFLRVLSTHRAEFGLTGKVGATAVARREYQSVVAGRRALFSSRCAAPAPLAPAAEKEAYRRQTLPRLLPEDRGFGAWLAACVAFVQEIEEAFRRGDDASGFGSEDEDDDDWDDTLARLALDVRDFLA